MLIKTETDQISLYETDYNLWLIKTVETLRNHDFASLDLENFIEEVESLGKGDQHAISSFLMGLCGNLLKIKYWDSERERCLRGWMVEITNFRIQIQERRENSPSLKRFLEANFTKQYQNGRKLFLQASELPAAQIPLEPCFSLEQSLAEICFPLPKIESEFS